MIEVNAHPVDARRLTIRMTGAEGAFLNMRRQDAYELAHAILAREPWISEPTTPSAA